jgi:hypothetical protein
MLRACNMLVHCMQENIRPTLVWAPITVLMQGERSSTEWQPGKRLWAQRSKLNEQPGIWTCRCSWVMYGPMTRERPHVLLSQAQLLPYKRRLRSPWRNSIGMPARIFNLARRQARSMSASSAL